MMPIFPLVGIRETVGNIGHWGDFQRQPRPILGFPVLTWFGVMSEWIRNVWPMAVVTIDRTLAYVIRLMVVSGRIVIWGFVRINVGWNVVGWGVTKVILW